MRHKKLRKMIEVVACDHNQLSVRLTAELQSLLGQLGLHNNTSCYSIPALVAAGRESQRKYDNELLEIRRQLHAIRTRLDNLETAGSWLRRDVDQLGRDLSKHATHLDEPDKQIQQGESHPWPAPDDPDWLDWRQEAADGDTRLGFEEWKEHRREAQAFEDAGAGSSCKTTQDCDQPVVGNCDGCPLLKEEQ